MKTLKNNIYLFLVCILTINMHASFNLDTNEISIESHNPTTRTVTYGNSTINITDDSNNTLTLSFTGGSSTYIPLASQSPPDGPYMSIKTDNTDGEVYISSMSTNVPGAIQLTTNQNGDSPVIDNYTFTVNVNWNEETLNAILPPSLIQEINALDPSAFTNTNDRITEANRIIGSRLSISCGSSTFSPAFELFSADLYKDSILTNYKLIIYSKISFNSNSDASLNFLAICPR